MSDKTLVTGEVVFEADTPPFADAVVTVRLEDVSLIDAPSKVVAEQVIRNVSCSGGGLPFELKGALPDDDRARYTVSAHVSLGGGRDVQQGDYITMQSYPVLTHGNPDRVTVQVKLVGGR